MPPLQDHLPSIKSELHVLLVVSKVVLAAVGVIDKRPKYILGRLYPGAGQLLQGSMGTFKQECKNDAILYSNF